MLISCGGAADGNSHSHPFLGSNHPDIVTARCTPLIIFVMISIDGFIEALHFDTLFFPLTLSSPSLLLSTPLPPLFVAATVTEKHRSVADSLSSLMLTTS